MKPDKQDMAWKAMVLLVGMALIGFAGTGALYAAVPVSDSFESYANGASISGTNGWGALVPANAIATNSAACSDALNAWSAETTCGYPLTNAAHTQCLGFTGVASNYFGDTSQQGLWFDFLVAPQSWTDSVPPVISSNSLFAFYVLPNRHVCVAHYSGFSPDATNRWTEIADLSISTTTWARITVNVIRQFDAAFFSFQIDGGVPVSNTLAFASPSETALPGGTWFPCANFRSCLSPSTFSLAGNGYLDDWVVTNAIPSLNAPQDSLSKALILPLYDTEKGAILPGEVQQIPVGHSTNFTIRAALHYHVAGLYTNEAYIAGDYETTPTNRFDFNWPAIPPGMHTLRAVFKPDLTTNKTSIPWLAQYYQTNDYDNASLNDDDGDSQPAWSEYLAGTDPTDPESFFRIVEQGVCDGSNYLVWVSRGVSADLPPFLVMRLTNILDQASWGQAGSVPRSATATTNIWYDPDSRPGTYYRIEVHHP